MDLLTRRYKSLARALNLELIKVVRQGRMRVKCSHGHPEFEVNTGYAVNRVGKSSMCPKCRKNSIVKDAEEFGYKLLTPEKDFFLYGEGIFQVKRSYTVRTITTIVSKKKKDIQDAMEERDN